MDTVYYIKSMTKTITKDNNQRYPIITKDIDTQDIQ